MHGNTSSLVEVMGCAASLLLIAPEGFQDAYASDSRVNQLPTRLQYSHPLHLKIRHARWHGKSFGYKQPLLLRTG